VEAWGFSPTKKTTAKRPKQAAEKVPREVLFLHMGLI
jgi:hypothetical protein